MKQALGRDGTGAGTVYRQTYMWGFKAGKKSLLPLRRA